MAKVTIIIKALNEQSNIARCIESSLAALAQFEQGEVILADSYSTDMTVSIASQYPVKIAQLLSAQDRSCGAGAQLGYLYAEGDYLYILDGDMEISEAFLAQAVQLMESKPDVAGVGGMVKEMHTESLEFQARAERGSKDMQAGVVDHLAMGGLYRRSAVDPLGYLTNRNLHSYEEFELGVRLRAAGWSLERIPVVSVKHYGHTLPEYRLLKKRWASGYINGVGELLRSSIGQPHFSLLLKELKELRLYFVVIAWWLALIMIFIFNLYTGSMFYLVPVVFILPFLAMLLKTKKIDRAVYSVIAWQFFSWGLIRGLFMSQKSLKERIPSQLLKQ